MLKSFFKVKHQSFLISMSNKIFFTVSSIKNGDSKTPLLDREEVLKKKITLIQQSPLSFPSDNISHKIKESGQSENNFRDSGDACGSVRCFSRSVSLIQRTKNCRKLTEAFACLLTEKQNEELIQIMTKYLTGEGMNINKGKATGKQKEMFKRVRKFLFHIVEDRESVEQILHLLSESDPNLISVEEIKKIHEFNNHERQISSRPRKYSLLFSAKTGEKNEELAEQKMLHLQMISKAKEKKKAILDQIQIRPARVQLKKPRVKSEFTNIQKSLQQAEQNLFDNKKMASQVIILKQKSNDQIDEYKQKYGQNWVYAYDMPYSFSNENVKKLLKKIEKQYGQIREYSFYPYKQMVQINSTEIYYSVPEEYNQQGGGIMDRMKLGKTKVEKINNGKQTKSLTQKILQKTKKDKQLSLNKTSMLFKFKKNEDKKKFLTPEMRLFGLNLNNSYNIRFEEAQSKTVIILSMIPWGCESDELFSVINRGLCPLKVTFSPEEPCRIARSSLFMQFTTFYDAFHAQKLLNNTIFQNERLKAQISYGACQVINGDYKTLLQFNHHDTLVDRLNQIQCFYNDVYRYE